MTEETGAERLVYLYGIVPADAPEPTPGLQGVGGAPVRLVRQGGLAGVFSEVPASEYSDEVLDARMGDLTWVGECGIAHERVLDWFADHGPIVPLSLFSLHGGEERIRAHLLSEEDRLVGLLERLRGKREWGIKLWRRERELGERLGELSPLLRALRVEMEKSAPERRALLEQKRETAAAEEMRSLSRRVTHHVFATLRSAADRAVTVPLPADAPEAERSLLLHAAFLVPEDTLSAFQRRVNEVAHEFSDYGFELEFTGPWPPYHFVESESG